MTAKKLTRHSSKLVTLLVVAVLSLTVFAMSCNNGEEKAKEPEVPAAAATDSAASKAATTDSTAQPAAEANGPDTGKGGVIPPPPPK